MASKQANALLIRGHDDGHEGWAESFWEIRNSFSFLSSFHQLKEICRGDPEVLLRLDWRDPIVKSVCDEVSEGALRVPSKHGLGSSGHFSESFRDINSSFDSYEHEWKINVIKVRDNRINNLFIRSLNEYYRKNYINSNESNLILEDRDPYPNELVGWFMYFLVQEGFVVPRSAQWRAFYHKISKFVADWRLPARQPGPDSGLQSRQQSIRLLTSQLHWAAENGRLFEAIKFLGSLAIEDWEMRD